MQALPPLVSEEALQNVANTWNTALDAVGKEVVEFLAKKGL